MKREQALLVREMQDLSTTLEGVAAVLREKPVSPVTDVKQGETVVNVAVPEQPAPTVNVQVPEQPAPTVNVQVPKQPPPVVNVQRAEPVAYTVRITQRDANGFISEFVIMPLNAGGE